FSVALSYLLFLPADKISTFISCAHCVKESGALEWWSNGAMSLDQYSNTPLLQHSMYPLQRVQLSRVLPQDLPLFLLRNIYKTSLDVLARVRPRGICQWKVR